MWHRLSLLLAGALLCSSAAGADIDASGGWVWHTRPGQLGSSGGLTLHSSLPATLLAAYAPGVGRIELHRSRVDSHGRRVMQRLSSLQLPAGQTLTLSEDGVHLMLLGLRRPLPAGGTLPLLLTLQRARGQHTVVTLLRIRAYPSPPSATACAPATPTPAAGSTAACRETAQ